MRQKDMHLDWFVYKEMYNTDQYKKVPNVYENP